MDSATDPGCVSQVRPPTAASVSVAPVPDPARPSAVTALWVSLICDGASVFPCQSWPWRF